MIPATARPLARRRRAGPARPVAAGAGLVLALAAASAGGQGSAIGALRYPSAPRGTQVDDYHGVKVADPYRWLENVDSPATREWIAAENALTSEYLATIPEREAIRSRLTALSNYAQVFPPTRAGKRYFYFENPGLRNQPVLYVQDSWRDRPRALVDPNALSRDGTAAVPTFAPSRDGRLLAYGVAAGGSDWEEIRVRDVKSGRDLSDTLRWVKFSDVAWMKNGKGFFYSRYDEPPAGTNTLTGPHRNHKLYYHAIGRRQATDRLVYERPEEPNWLFQASVSDDGQYVVITVRQGAGTRNRLYFIDLDDARAPILDAPAVKLIDTFDASFDFVGNQGTRFYLRTDLNAPRGRVVAVDIDAPRQSAWRTVIPERADVLTSVSIVGGTFVSSYLRDARSRLELVPLVSGGAAGDVPLPGLGTVDSIRGRPQDTEFFFRYRSYLQPAAVYRYDLKAGKSELVKGPTGTFDAASYETRQVFFTSRDGTRVPMFITARKNLARDGTHPTLLHGYGGFDISLTPDFKTETLVWLEMGGVYAVANLRGGGEYGAEWHEAGTLAKKQNVFDDFIAAAEYLVKEKYTSSPKLAIYGRSNGGLLVGAAMTQRPELFGAALPTVGVLDMLRFQQFTIGRAWVQDCGSSEDSAQFRFLRAYSPLHNVRAGTRYPATLIATGDHDDRVVPAHSFKFAAALQAAQAGPAPVLIRIDTRAGHGAGKPMAKLIGEATDRFAFLVRALQMEAPRLGSRE